MDEVAWQATHGVAKSRTQQLNNSNKVKLLHWNWPMAKLSRLGTFIIGFKLF